MSSPTIDDRLAEAGIPMDAAPQDVIEAVDRLFPNDLLVRLILGDRAFERRAFDDAMFWYELGNRISHRNFWTYFNRARVAQARGDIGAALGFLEQGFETCKGHVPAAEYDNLGKLYSEIRVAQCLKPEAEQVRLLNQPNKVGAPLPNALRVTVVKDEDDVIYAGLRSSYVSGLRYFAIADNGSTDRTADEIRRFAADHPDAIVYTVFDPIVGHYQEAKTMGLARLGSTILAAVGVTVDWVFPLDTDEEIHLPEDGPDLATVMAGADAAGAKMLTYVFCDVSADHVIEECTSLDSLPGPYRFNSPPRHPPVRKVAFRLLPDAYIEAGNHYCAFSALSGAAIVIGAEHDVSLKHYSVRSIEQMRKKIRNTEKSLDALQGPSYIGWHWRQAAQNYHQHGDDNLRQKMQRHIELVIGDVPTS